MFHSFIFKLLTYSSLIKLDQNVNNILVFDKN